MTGGSHENETAAPRAVLVLAVVCTALAACSKSATGDGQPRPDGGPSAGGQPKLRHTLTGHTDWIRSPAFRLPGWTLSLVLAETSRGFGGVFTEFLRPGKPRSSSSGRGASGRVELALQGEAAAVQLFPRHLAAADGQQLVTRRSSWTPTCAFAAW